MESFGAAEAAGGEGLRLAILPSTAGVTRVAYPEPLRAWIYGWATGESGADGPPAILGTATATVAGGAPIPLDRVAGPSVALVTLADVQWCEGPDGPADAATIRGLTVTAGPATQIIYGGAATSALIGGIVWAGSPGRHGGRHARLVRRRRHLGGRDLAVRRPDEVTPTGGPPRPF